MARRLAAPRFAVLAVGLCALLFPAGATATNPGNNGLIAFTAGRDGNAEIYVMTPSGTGPVNLTNNPASDTTAEWNATGTKLAFASDRDGDAEIYTMNADGSGVTQLTFNTTADLDPTWSPDGTQIAFRRDVSGNNEIFTMTSSGGSQTNRTNNAASDFVPDWSPLGNLIAFQRFTTGGNNEIHTMTPTGGSQTNITNNVTNDGRPSFSPDGTRIAFDSNRQSAASTTIDDFEIYTMSPTGATVTQLTNNTTAGSPAADVNDQKASWSPNGALISFQSNRDFPNGTNQNEIYRMTNTGASQTRLTNNTTNDFDSAWQPDSIPPETTITGGPSDGGLTNDNTPTFSFASSDLNSTFQCSVDGAAFTTCTSPFTPAALSNGVHTFAVRAIDVASNTDATPATRSFTVDAAAPETTIDSGPSGRVDSTSATFDFSSNEANTTFECSLDGAPFAACGGPASPGSITYTGLSQGSHTFLVRATDPAGNTDQTPASRTWIVDTVPPQTTIDSGPTDPSDVTDETFEFSSSEPNSTFECRLDGGEWEACSSPKTYEGFEDGQHTFEVRATDEAGNTDQTPASYTWETAAPTAFITRTPGTPFGEITVFGGPDRGADIVATFADDPNPAGIDSWTFVEQNGTLDADQGGCVQEAPDTVRCDSDGTGSADNMTANLGDENDSFAFAGDPPPPGTTRTINGDADNDTIEGSDGPDTINGGTGNDVITGNGGADTIDGGDGIDRADYSDSTAPTNVTLDNAPNDIDGNGAIGENVSDTVEAVSGSTTAGDNITGSNSNNAFAGQGGNDTIDGAPGNDFITGGAGDDDITGGNGIDRVSYTGNSAGQASTVTLDNQPNDTDGNGGSGLENIHSDVEYLFGSPGADTFDASGNGANAVALWGRAGDDTLIGSEVDDFLDGQAGADNLDCSGGSNDMYYSDEGQPGGDASVTNCETAATSAPKETP